MILLKFVISGRNEEGRVPSNAVSAGIKDYNVLAKLNIIPSLIRTFWVDSEHLFFTPN